MQLTKLEVEGRLGEERKPAFEWEADPAAIDPLQGPSYPTRMIQSAFDLADDASSLIPFETFPSTRYQGSKRKLLSFLHEACRRLTFDTVLDLYSGTASVSLLFRQMDKTVFANDYLLYNSTTARVLLTATNEWLSSLNLPALVEQAFTPQCQMRHLVEEHFQGIYFPDAENRQIDDFCANLPSFEPPERDLLIYLMGQAMLMKRPYNLFHRANLEMRTKDVPRSFGNAKTWATPFATHMLKLGAKLKKCSFHGPRGEAYSVNAVNLDQLPVEPDLVYLDPPYLNKKNVPVDYSGFYHFLEGLVEYDLFAAGDPKYPHKPIALKPSRWRKPAGGLLEIADVLKRWPNATVAISYRGDGMPSIDDIKGVLAQASYRIEEHTAVDYKYALSKNFDATEDLIVGRPMSL